MLELLRNEVSPMHGKKPFSTEYTKKLREIYLKEQGEELK